MKSILGYGFRPHFFLAGVAALILIPVWALNITTSVPVSTTWPPTLWHAHEMLFGFIACAIAGFLLTAVPSWTGQKGYAGTPLALMALLWLLARVMVVTAGWWPPVLVAIIDLAFLPALMILIGIPLLRSRNRNTPLLLAVLLLWLTDVCFQWALLQHDPSLARRAVMSGINLVLIMVTVIGGRIVPAFTSSGLKQSGVVVVSHPLVSTLAISGMILLAVSDLLWPERPVTAVIAVCAAVFHVVRLMQWKTARTLKHPIIWILHAAYAWLPIGLVLKALAIFGIYGGSFWLHALTVGALTTMIMAVMTRASLGHTGRPLVVHPLITVAYLLLTAAAFTRVFAMALFQLNYSTMILLSATLWSAAFAIYLYVYTPILWGPRADGKPG